METIKAWTQNCIYNTAWLWRPDFEYAGQMYQSGAPRWYWLWTHVLSPLLAWCEEN